MTDREANSIYQSAYRQVLTNLRAHKAEEPENYAVLARFVEEFRDWTTGVSGLGDLPPVPKE